PSRILALASRLGGVATNGRRGGPGAGPVAGPQAFRRPGEHRAQVTPYAPRKTRRGRSDDAPPSCRTFRARPKIPFRRGSKPHLQRGLPASGPSASPGRLTSPAPGWARPCRPFRLPCGGPCGTSPASRRPAMAGTLIVALDLDTRNEAEQLIERLG